jgi:hypothetical protein
MPLSGCSLDALPYHFWIGGADPDWCPAFPPGTKDLTLMCPLIRGFPKHSNLDFSLCGLCLSNLHSPWPGHSCPGTVLCLRLCFYSSPSSAVSPFHADSTHAFFKTQSWPVNLPWPPTTQALGHPFVGAFIHLFTYYSMRSFSEPDHALKCWEVQQQAHEGVHVYRAWMLLNTSYHLSVRSLSLALSLSSTLACEFSLFCDSLSLSWPVTCYVSGWPQTCNLPASSSQVVGLQMCNPTILDFSLCFIHAYLYPQHVWQKK